MFKSIIILYCYIPIILGSFSSPNSLPGGLKFKGNDHPIRKRTSYNVFHDRKVEFNEYFDIEFKMSLSSDMLIGYIIRIKNEESNKVFNLFYDGNGNDLIFKFNEEGRNSLITAVMNKEELLNKRYQKFRSMGSFCQEEEFRNA